ncbi:putative V-type proton ATPase subunit D-like [Capsicum annuum]|nr:putative V-type proton ATPase subunit D-like [Capsicum annuum]KAF3675900.1 putative V-type proton ATPase subunit D-like [Capsicum annuum]
MKQKKAKSSEFTECLEGNNSPQVSKITEFSSPDKMASQPECSALLYLPADSPDAQIFYNGSSGIAGSPLANSPIPSVGSSPTAGAAGVASAPKSAGCHIGKRCLRALEIESNNQWSDGDSLCGDSKDM